jgi:serine/threonine protein kinase
MEWVHGEPLNSFIDRNIGSADKIRGLIPEFKALVEQLRKLGIAHGDLQHGNILVMNGRLYLIDYDGMYLPALSHLKTNELGHVNYQHPGRAPTHYGPYLDRFASITIYLGLSAIADRPDLWNKYNNSENILFRAADFVDVATSSLLREIAANPKLAQSVDRFRGVCKLDFLAVPDLDTFLSGSFTYPKVAVPNIVAPKATPTVSLRSQYAILDASDRATLLQFVGQRVEVVGLMMDHHSARTRHGRPYLFLNFGVYPRQTLTVVLWSPALSSFQKTAFSPKTLVGQWVKVSGVLGSYRGRPQMEVEMPSQIQALSGEIEARQWLRSQSATVPTSTGSKRAASSPGQRKSVRASPDEVFNQLYANRSSKPAPPPLQTVTTRPSAQKQPPNVVTGYALGALLGILGWMLWGFWGFVAGALVGYQIGSRLKI